MAQLAEVAVLLPVEGTYTYMVPPGLQLAPGARVWVPFGGRSVEGVVLSLDVTAPPQGTSLRSIARSVEAPPVEAELLSLSRWIAEYYLAPPGEALRLMLPPGGRATEAAHVQLTAEGERAAAALGQALEPAVLEGLSLRSRAILERLRGGSEKLRALVREVDGARAALVPLTQRRLVELSRDVKVRREREEEFVQALPSPSPEVVAQLQRAPRRRALYEQIAAAGELPMSTLREADDGARGHVRALVSAGLCLLQKRSAEAPDPFASAHVDSRPPPELTAGQALALGEVARAIQTSTFAGFLLHGATGSGKTEVYLRAIRMALDMGRGALVLVPEISLTPQLSARFRGRFGDEVAVLHSSLSDRERFDAWARLRAGRARIALGARSAVFAPVRRLGVVVIDEEHDGSFKQEDGLRYHARDVAVVRARESSAVAILGSATPSLETFEAARAARLSLLSLPERANGSPLPTVQIVDLRQHKREEGGSLLSAPLAAALDEALRAGEQAILFLNRRGFATFVLCTACGHRFVCRHCAVTLTWHRADDRLACHYCGYLEPTPHRCPRCQAQAVERLGLGTERVEADVAERFPTARIARLDRDTAHGRNLTRILEKVRRHELDVLVGTQMLAKGHDFPNVTLVGVILADTGMNLPDFRAAERTFQLLAQVAGRAGRGQRPGRVVVQTFTPEHPAVQCAREHDFLRFFEVERAARQECQYPPSSRLGLLRVDGEDPIAVRCTAEAAGEAARQLRSRAPIEARVEILGPAEAPLSRLKGKTRWQLLVKAATPKAVRAVLLAARAVEVPRGTRVSVDVDPVSML